MDEIFKDVILIQQFIYLTIPVEDMDEEIILPFFEQAIEFIDKGRSIGNVLVHW